MPVKPRRTPSPSGSAPDPRRDAEIERFGAAAEKEAAELAARSAAPTRMESRSEPSTDPIERWRQRRDSGPKAKGYNFRMTAAQAELLSLVAHQQDRSQQKILDDLVWPALEEKYGHLVEFRVTRRPYQ